MIADLAYIPEVDPFSLNFLSAGYTNILLVINCIVPIFLVLLHIVLFVLLGLLILAHSVYQCICGDGKSSKCDPIKWARDKLENYLLWDGCIRLLMEAYS